MHALTIALSAIADPAIPTPTMTVNPDAVTPGFVGFVGIAVVALIDMLRRIRRAGYRAEIAEELDATTQADAEARAHEQAAAAVEASDTDDQDIDPASR